MANKYSLNFESLLFVKHCVCVCVLSYVVNGLFSGRNKSKVVKLSKRGEGGGRNCLQYFLSVIKKYNSQCTINNLENFFSEIVFRTLFTQTNENERMDLKNVVKIRRLGGGGILRTALRRRTEGGTSKILRRFCPVSGEMLLMNKNIVRRRLYRDGERVLRLSTDGDALVRSII